MYTAVDRPMALLTLALQVALHQAMTLSSPAHSSLYARSSEPSGCANFFIAQEGCAATSSSSNCRPKVTSGVILQFTEAPAASAPYTPFGGAGAKTSAAQKTPGKIAARASEPSTQDTRNTPKQASTAVGSSGVCGSYSSEADMGVCLWSGSGSAPSAAKAEGWIAPGATSNCRKEVIFQRSGSSEPPMTAAVLDGCNFGTSQASLGCSQIFLTKKAFMAMNPTDEEKKNGYLKDTITWDFASKSNANNMPN